MPKRKKNWPSHSKAPPTWAAMLDNQGKVDTTKQEFTDFAEWLYAWSRDMHSWGADTRDDVVRLEGHAGFATGDPGDPPDGRPE
jgi:hypothetical protein